MRVGVIGAGGRMGSEVCRAVDAAEGLELVAAVDPHHVGEQSSAGGLTVAGELAALVAAEVEVAVDFTRPDTVVANVNWLLEHGIHAVVGTTGLTDADLDAFRANATTCNVLVAPNFAIGAVLMMQFAAQAARHLHHVEIIERHHDGKLDAPSGTALRTAELIADAAGDDLADAIGGDDKHPGARGASHRGVPIHSVRLPGLVAHQEVQLGGTGETLTILHDSIHRESFMPGVVLAIRRVSDLDGLVVGLEHLLAAD